MRRFYCGHWWEITTTARQFRIPCAGQRFQHNGADAATPIVTALRLLSHVVLLAHAPDKHRASFSPGTAARVLALIASFQLNDDYSTAAPVAAAPDNIRFGRYSAQKTRAKKNRSRVSVPLKTYAAVEGARK